MGRPGWLGLWIFGKKYIHKVLGVLMVRFFAVASNSCLVRRSFVVFFTMFSLMKVRSWSTLA